MTIDIIIRGLDRGAGRGKDRFQLRVEPDKKASREQMLRELASRIGGMELLRALYDKRFALEELYQAYIRGVDALSALAERKQAPPLSTLMGDYVTSLRTRSKDATEKYLTRFRESLNGEDDLAAFTAKAAEGWLQGLKDTRADGEREVSAATKNRALMALKGFGTWCVEHGYLDKHPLRTVKAFEEDVRRIRALTPDEYRAYYEDMSARNPELVPVFKTLMHTGADVGEVVPTRLADGSMSKPFLVRDCDFDRDLPRILFKRTKVRKSPERLVPVPQGVAALIQAHIERHGLQLNDPVFGMFTNEQLRYAHQRTRAAIGRPDLRRKDLRHVAAVLWRWAGVDLDRIREWLGHSSIVQTIVYAAFGPLDSFDKPAIERVESILKLSRPKPRSEAEPMEVAA